MPTFAIGEARQVTIAIAWPLAPMEARPVDDIPRGGGWQYEPKWDGFRCLARSDGGDVDLRSKSGQPLGRYFPEIVAALEALPARDFIVDGELVVAVADELSFDELQLRLHPAASRVRMLADRTPATLVLFDLLAEAGASLLELPLAERRRRLEAFAAAIASPRFALSPATTDAIEAQAWLHEMGGGLDGIIAKLTAAPYGGGARDAMVKFKNMRSADCVIGGFRYAAGRRLVGSLLLGLYGADGLLHHVGFTSAIKDRDRGPITGLLEGLRGGSGFTGRGPGGPSRWNRGKATPWEPLRPCLVVEVCYDHVTGGRFRHGVALLRWRADKAPAQCRYDQLTRETASALHLIAEMAPNFCPKSRA